jgi:hypothetical protein
MSYYSDYGSNYGYNSGYSSWYGGSMSGLSYKPYGNLFASDTDGAGSGDSGNDGDSGDDGWWPDFLSGTKEAAEDAADKTGETLVTAGVAALYEELGITGRSNGSNSSSDGSSNGSSNGSWGLTQQMQTVMYAVGGALGLVLIVEFLTAQ